MDIDSAKKFVEKNGGDYESIVDSMPARFIEPIVTHGLKIDEVERGRVLCSYAIPPRILNTGNTLHGGAIATLVDVIGSVAIATMIPGSEFSGVSVDISVSYLDSASVGEEIEIEAKTLKVGKSIGVASVELRKKKTGKVIAQGRHTKYLAPPKCDILAIKRFEVHLESAKKYVEKNGGGDSMPPEFIQPMVLYGIRVDEVERGRILCSYAVPPRLLNAGNSTLHGGAIVTLVDLIGAAAISSTGAVLSGVAIDIGVSYLDGASVGEEIEIEAKALKVGRGIGVVTVEFRRKRTRKVIALGRHTTYLFASSKL